VVIDIINEPKRAAMLQAMASEPTVTAYAAVRPDMIARPHEAVEEIGARRISVACKVVSPEYFDVFAIPILRGRSLTTAERDGEHPVLIVSESIARELWPNGSGVGETLRLEPDRASETRPKDEPPMPARLVTAVGVSRDVAGFRFTDLKDAGIFLPTGVDAPKTSVAARVKGDAELARRRARKRSAPARGRRARATPRTRSAGRTSRVLPPFASCTIMPKFASTVVR